MEIRYRSLGIAALALALRAPTPAAAETTVAPALAAGTYYYDTYFTPEYYGAGSYEGVLRITVAPDGTISGIFRDVDAGGFRDVTGGESGGAVWLDLGNSEFSMINLHAENGKLVGGIYTPRQPYSFVAVPQAHPSL
jgi:hypothetical protein